MLYTQQNGFQDKAKLYVRSAVFITSISVVCLNGEQLPDPTYDSFRKAITSHETASPEQIKRITNTYQPEIHETEKTKPPNSYSADILRKSLSLYVSPFA